MKKKGFTLIELMVVIAIIGLLAAIALPKFSDVASQAKVANVQGNLSSVRTAIAMYYAKADEYPTLAETGANDDLTLVTTTDGDGTVATFTDFYSKNVMADTPATTNLTTNVGATNTITAVETTGNSFTATGNGGWAYRTDDGAIRANLATDTYMDNEGVDWAQF